MNRANVSDIPSYVNIMGNIEVSKNDGHVPISYDYVDNVVIVTGLAVTSYHMFHVTSHTYPKSSENGEAGNTVEKQHCV